MKKIVIISNVKKKPIENMSTIYVKSLNDVFRNISVIEKGIAHLENGCEKIVFAKDRLNNIEYSKTKKNINVLFENWRSFLEDEEEFELLSRIQKILKNSN